MAPPPNEVAAPAASQVGGQGSDLVLLHGLGNTREVWKPVIPALEARHRVIALTLPGHYGGPEYKGEGDASVPGLADQVIAMLRAQGITHAHVAGNSLGGWLAIELARRGFARSVTAFSPAGGWRIDGDYRSVSIRFRIAYALIGVALSDIEDPGSKELACAELPVAAIRQIHVLAAVPRDLLPRIKFPTLVIQSRDDHVVNPRNGRRIVRLVGSSRELLWLDNSFHVATLDHDKDLIAERTAAFIKSIAGRRARVAAHRMYASLQ